MSRWSIRWLLLGVAGASLLLPLLALLLLRIIDPYLVQQTERELRSEGALIAEFYHAAWAEALGVAPGDPRPAARKKDAFIPNEPLLRDVHEFAANLPEELPKRSRNAAVQVDARRLSRILRSAQIFNLSGVRVLDETGCAVASSREQLDHCFYDLPEVKSALAGKYASVLRERFSDEPAPPYGSMRRRGDVRVFVAMPVHDEGKVIGAVWLSRTAESSLEFLFKQRRGVFYAGLGLMATMLAVSALFARLIVVPIQRMEQAATTLTRQQVSMPLSDIPAPREVHALGRAFDLLTARLRARSDYISEFAANVSHELKTPLTSIRGAVELLRDESNVMAEEQRQRFFANIEAATRRTERLVERLLLLARLEHQDQASDADVVQVKDWFDALAADLGDKLSLQISQAAESARVPSIDLDSIVRNLVDNALRVRKLLPVRVTLEREDQFLKLTVEDDGPGISPANQAQLFKRFFTTERDRGGTGLGLAIVKAVAERRGGRVTLETSTSGTRVIVWF